MQFYSVKERKMVDVPDNQVKTEKYERTRLARSSSGRGRR